MQTRVLFIFAAALLAYLLAACQPESSESESASNELANAPAVPAEADPADPSRTAMDEGAQQTETCELTVGWDPWEPYHYRVAGSDQVRGMDIEIIQAVADEAACSLTFEQGPWSELLRKLREGQIDVMMGATRIPERESFAHFSDAYREDRFLLYIQRGEQGRVEGHSLESLMEDGFRLGVTQGYYYGEAFNELQMRPEFAEQIVDAAVGEMNITHLLDDRIDGFLEHPAVAGAVKSRRGDAGSVIATELTVGGGPVTFMFSRQSVDEGVVQRFNEGLRAIRASGEHQRMIDRYVK